MAVLGGTDRSDFLMSTSHMEKSFFWAICGVVSFQTKHTKSSSKSSQAQICPMVPFQEVNNCFVTQTKSQICCNCFLSGRKLDIFSRSTMVASSLYVKLSCSAHWNGAGRVLCTRKGLAALGHPINALDQRHLERVLVWGSTVSGSGLPPTE